MENLSSSALMLSLADIALRKVVVNLWTETDILYLIVNYEIKERDHRKSKQEWQETVVAKVKEKVLKRALPEAIKKQIIHILNPIGLEILSWKRFHETYLDGKRGKLHVPTLKKLRWTSAGSVDYKNSAKEIIRSGFLSIENRYKLACLYCLQYYMPVLWIDLSDKLQKHFYRSGHTTHISKPLMHFCFPFILNGEEHKLDEHARSGLPLMGLTFYERAFQYSAYTHNKAAAEYFVDKFKRDKASVLTRTANHVTASEDMDPFEYGIPSVMKRKSEIMHYLFSLMTPEQQNEVIRKEPLLVWRCFMEWPRTDISEDIAELIWSFFPESRYDYLFRNLKNFTFSKKYYPEVFRSFFIHSPMDFKKRFLIEVEYGFCCYFRKWLHEQEVETIKVIFNSLDVEDRVQFVSSPRFLTDLHCCTIKREGTIQVWIRDIILSEEARERLKQALMEFFDADNAQESCHRERLDQILDEIYASDSCKRSSDSVTVADTKRFCPKNTHHA